MEAISYIQIAKRFEGLSRRFAKDHIWRCNVWKAKVRRDEAVGHKPERTFKDTGHQNCRRAVQTRQTAWIRIFLRRLRRSAPQLAIKSKLDLTPS